VNKSGLSERLSGSDGAGSLLLQEISHRVNNELASAIGLVSVMAMRTTSDDARAVLAKVQDRLENFARAGFQDRRSVPQVDRAGS
jgi:two-component sensor histidine kinase